MATMTVQMTDLQANRSNAASTPSSNSLEDCVVALQRGRDGALEQLIRKTEKACFHLAFSILKDRDLSKDALQDAYFVVFRRIDQLREPAAFKGWLFRIVTTSCHDILRKRGKEIEIDMSEREDLLTPDSPSDPSKQIPNRELLRSTFDNLPDQDRQALALREIASLSYEEMARVLSIPIGTVRSRLAKARKRFIKSYRKEQNQ